MARAAVKRSALSYLSPDERTHKWDVSETDWSRLPKSKGFADSTEFECGSVAGLSLRFYPRGKDGDSAVLVQLKSANGLELMVKCAFTVEFSDQSKRTHTSVSRTRYLRNFPIEMSVKCQSDDDAPVVAIAENSNSSGKGSSAPRAEASQESCNTLNAHSNGHWEKDENGKRKWVTTIDRPVTQVEKARGKDDEKTRGKGKALEVLEPASLNLARRAPVAESEEEEQEEDEDDAEEEDDDDEGECVI